MEQPLSPEIQRLLKDLSSRDEFVRQTAVTELGKAKLNDKRIVSALQMAATSDKSKFVKEAATQALNTLMGTAPVFEWKCSSCGQQQQAPLFSNHCLQCNAPYLPSRFSEEAEFPAVSEPPEITCYQVQGGQVTVSAGPQAQTETIYVIGKGDILPIVGAEDEYYQVMLHHGEVGYVPKSLGKQFEIGAGEVKQPLGYIRLIDPNYLADVTFTQPNGSLDILYSMKKEDRLPVVAEQDHAFKVQLPSGVRGWVNKGRVLRTISSDSLPAQEPAGLLTVVGLAALAGAAIAVEMLKSDMGENKIRRGVVKGLRDRGL